MRAISLVDKIEFVFSSNVVKNAVTLGDIDNDGCNELIVGNEAGEVSIFKGEEKLQTLSKLGFVVCVAVGDVRNEKQNSLVIVTGNGYCYIYEVVVPNATDEVDGQSHSASQKSTTETQSSSESTHHSGEAKSCQKSAKDLITCVHKQRIPANVKSILLGDVDSDGNIEMIVGLTDRIVRSYRWQPSSNKLTEEQILDPSFNASDETLGSFIALNKWECANQIGSITLHHSVDGLPALLVAQPGGTFLRIRCNKDDSFKEDDSTNSGDSKTAIDYQSLGISRMRNPNISTEIVGDLQTCRRNSFLKASSSKSDSEDDNTSTAATVFARPYALATLDGTIMLVQDEVILWAFAVDHQVFALTKFDVTGNGCDDIVACCWDGHTYILDQEKNCVRFELEEPVQAFYSGLYSVQANKRDSTAFVYVTFKNKIIIYHNIPLKEMTCKKIEPNLELLSQLFIDEHRNAEQAVEYVKSMDKKTKKELIDYLLYHANNYE